MSAYALDDDNDDGAGFITSFETEPEPEPVEESPEKAWKLSWLEWPKNPVEGQMHKRIDPIGGASYNIHIFKDGEWKFVRNE